MIKLKFKVVKKGDMLDRINKSVMRLEKEYTKAGYFASQGKHIGADQTPYLSYPAMAQALETGVFGEVFRIPLPFMEHIGNVSYKRFNSSRRISREYKKWGRRLHYRKTNPAPLLDAVGETVKFHSKEVFNNSKYFPQAPQNKTPVWESGEMKDMFTYMNSVDKKVK